MKTLIQTLFFFLLISQVCFAQWVQTSGPYGADITSFAVIDEYLCAGTPDGGIFRSSNYGDSWEAVNFGLEGFQITALISGGTKLFAGVINYESGNNIGDIYLSEDIGISWIKVSTLPSPVSCFGVKDTFLFAGTYEGLYRSTDYGLSWIAVNSGLTNYDIHAFAVKDTNIFVGTSGGGVFRSTNNGTNWSLANYGLPGGYIKSFTVKDTILFTLNFYGLYYSTDNGLSWFNSTPPPNGVISALEVYANNLIALSFNGFMGISDTDVLLSTDNGLSWSIINSGFTQLEISQIISKDSILFAGTKGWAYNEPWGGVFRSADGGFSWSGVNHGLANTDVIFLAVRDSMLFANVWRFDMVMGGVPGRIQLSTDNGSSWNYADSGLTDPWVNDFVFSGTEIFIGTTSNANTPGGVFISTNYGLSWDAAGLQGKMVSSLLIVNDSCFLAGVKFNSPEDGVFLSTNKGISWNLTDLQYVVRKMAAINSTEGTKIFAGTGQGVFLSTDYGGSWNPVNNGLPSLHIKSMAVFGTTIFTSVDSGYLCRSTNYGNNWEIVYSGIYTYSLIVVGTNLIAYGYFSVQQQSGIYLSTNSGVDWLDISYGLPDYGLGPTIAGNETYVFAGLNERGVWKRPLSEIITSVGESTIQFPEKFSLHQNYPNPFNPSTTISWQSPVSSWQTIKVYDVLGNEIEILVNEEKPVGIYEITWYAEELPSGIYFYQLKAGSFVETKKMILLK